MPNWFIVNSSNPKLAVQGGASAGSGVTLQTLDTANVSQQWTVQLQVANGYSGVALVNANTSLAVTFNGTRDQLTMESYSALSVDQDAWLLMPAGGSNSFRVVWPADTSWSWNDKNGNFKPGDELVLWNDQSPNSVWSPIYQ